MTNNANPNNANRTVRRLLIATTLLFLGSILFVPLAVVFIKAFGKGLSIYWQSVTEANALSAVKLTLIAAGIAVPLNLVFGLFASWAIAKFEFVGKSVLISLIDLPFAISPVIAGLIYVLIFAPDGWLGPWLRNPYWPYSFYDSSGAWHFAAFHFGRGLPLRLPWPQWNGFGHGWPMAFHLFHPTRIKVLFAVPAIVLATIFVTFPFVARELIPLMQEQGSEEEQAALSLGASGWATFRRVTLPNVRWALIYGVILCTARAMGEFGAVAIVSGRIRGMTNTLPLHVELLYSENVTAAFAVSTLLALLALVTLAIKSFAERKRRSV